MPDEETKDQPQEETKEVQPEESKDSYTVPKTGHFTGNEMAKFIEQMGGDKEPSPDKPVVEKSVEKSVAKDTKKPCTDCDDKETKPHAVLKMSDGTEKVFQKKSDLEKLGMLEKDYTQKRQEDAKWEKTLENREDSVKALGQKMDELMKLGNYRSNQDSEKTDAEIEREAIDPAVMTEIQKLEKEVSSLQQDNKSLKGSENQRTLETATERMNQITLKAREEHPFDEYVDKESGRNITRDIFGALLTANITKVLEDPNTDKTKLNGAMPDFVKKTAADISSLQAYFKNKYSGDNGAAEGLTSDSVIKDHPTIADEIGQRAVADYLNGKSETSAPIAKSETADTSPERSLKKDQKPQSLRELMNEAKNSDFMKEAVKEAQSKGGVF